MLKRLWHNWAIMNRLTPAARASVLNCLIEGCSIRSTVRMTGVSKKAVSRLLVEAGNVAAEYQDRVMRNLPCKRVQVDELWTFNYCKAKNVTPKIAAKVPGAGSVWLWVSMCADTKIVPCVFMGGRDAGAAHEFMTDLASRLRNRVQLTSDGHRPYLEAVESAFGAEVDYAMLGKLYGHDPEGERRYTRLSNGFSRKIENHMAAVALNYFAYNFIKIHSTLRTSPAMAAGVTTRLFDVSDLVALLIESESAKAA